MQTARWFLIMFVQTIVIYEHIAQNPIITQSVCARGYYQDAIQTYLKCMPCYYLCQECSGSSEQNCLSCQNGYIMQNGTCQSYSCHQSCMNCNGPTQFNCTLCDAAKQHQLIDQQCLETCQDVTNCAYCVNQQQVQSLLQAYECKTCNLGYFVNGQNCAQIMVHTIHYATLTLEINIHSAFARYINQFQVDVIRQNREIDVQNLTIVKKSLFRSQLAVQQQSSASYQTYSETIFIYFDSLFESIVNNIADEYQVSISTVGECNPCFYNQGFGFSFVPKSANDQIGDCIQPILLIPRITKNSTKGDNIFDLTFNTDPGKLGDIINSVLNMTILSINANDYKYVADKQESSSNNLVYFIEIRASIALISKPQLRFRLAVPPSLQRLCHYNIDDEEQSLLMNEAYLLSKNQVAQFQETSSFASGLYIMVLLIVIIDLIISQDISISVRAVMLINTFYLTKCLAINFPPNVSLLYSAMFAIEDKLPPVFNMQPDEADSAGMPSSYQDFNIEPYIFMNLIYSVEILFIYGLFALAIHFTYPSIQRKYSSVLLQKITLKNYQKNFFRVFFALHKIFVWGFILVFIVSKYQDLAMFTFVSIRFHLVSSLRAKINFFFAIALVPLIILIPRKFGSQEAIHEDYGIEIKKGKTKTDKRDERMESEIKRKIVIIDEINEEMQIQPDASLLRRIQQLRKKPTKTYNSVVNSQNEQISLQIDQNLAAAEINAMELDKIENSQQIIHKIDIDKEFAPGSGIKDIFKMAQQSNAVQQQQSIIQNDEQKQSTANIGMRIHDQSQVQQRGPARHQTFQQSVIRRKTWKKTTILPQLPQQSYNDAISQQFLHKQGNDQKIDINAKVANSIQKVKDAIKLRIGLAIQRKQIIQANAQANSLIKGIKESKSADGAKQNSLSQMQNSINSINTVVKEGAHIKKFNMQSSSQQAQHEKRKFLDSQMQQSSKIQLHSNKKRNGKLQIRSIGRSRTTNQQISSVLKIKASLDKQQENEDEFDNERKRQKMDALIASKFGKGSTRIQTQNNDEEQVQERNDEHVVAVQHEEQGDEEQKDSEEEENKENEENEDNNNNFQDSKSISHAYQQSYESSATPISELNISQEQNQEQQEQQLEEEQNYYEIQSQHSSSLHSHISHISHISQSQNDSFSSASVISIDDFKKINDDIKVFDKHEVKYIEDCKEGNYEFQKEILGIDKSISILASTIQLQKCKEMKPRKQRVINADELVKIRAFQEGPSRGHQQQFVSSIFKLLLNGQKMFKYGCCCLVIISRYITQSCNCLKPLFKYKKRYLNFVISHPENYILIDLSRHVLVQVVNVFLFDVPLVAVSLMLMLHFVFMYYLIRIRPFNNKRLFRITVYWEICIWFSFIFLIILSLWDSVGDIANQDQRIMVGWMFIGSLLAIYVLIILLQIQTIIRIANFCKQFFKAKCMRSKQVKRNQVLSNSDLNSPFAIQKVELETNSLEQLNKSKFTEGSINQAQLNISKEADDNQQPLFLLKEKNTYDL